MHAECMWRQIFQGGVLPEEEADNVLRVYLQDDYSLLKEFYFLFMIFELFMVKKVITEKFFDQFVVFYYWRKPFLVVEDEVKHW